MTQTDQLDYTDPLLGIDKHFEHLPKKTMAENNITPKKEELTGTEASTKLPASKSYKLELINKARRIIRGEHTLNRKELMTLIGELENYEQFSYATEVLLVRMKLDESRGLTLTLKDYETLAKYIYKDHSLPSAFKFKKALQELTSHENLFVTKKCETLGLAGAIYKRKWQFDHQFKNLEFALHYYKRGYEQWQKFITTYNSIEIASDTNDDGYNAINYAFINEQMAVDVLVEHGKITGFSNKIRQYFEDATSARQFILQQLVKENADGTLQLLKANDAPWILATVAEAYFGLKKYRQARVFIEKYLELQQYKPWERRSFTRQMFSLAYLHSYCKEFASKYDRKSLPMAEELEEITRNINLDEVERCLQLLKDETNGDEDAVYISNEKKRSNIREEGKTGLALSGGGFRSALFHIGVLAALAEKDELKNIEVISCVSGGSIIGAFYYLKLKALLERKADDQITREDYITIVKEIEKEFLSGVQNNLRMRIFTNLVSNFKMFRDDYSRTHRLGELYEEHLFKKLIHIQRTEEEKEDGKKDNEIYMSDLFIKPKGVTAGFSIALDNWQRKNKIPQLVLNATSVNTGHNWQFTASWMGEPPGNIQTDIDAKPRLRRMYYEEAPDNYKHFRLGYAVGASSCVPVMFHPMPMPDLYPDIDLELIDGGVHDNQGISALIEQECKNMIISDGSGQMETSKGASKNSGSLFFRSDTILQERLRELQFLDIKQRNSTTQINKLTTVHLKADLENRPISWKFCTDPARTIIYGNVANNESDLTRYGILRKVQLSLAEVRTDLDSFNDLEAYALMYSGYAQVRYEYKKRQDDSHEEVSDETDAVDWRFLAVKDYVTMPDKAAEKEQLFKEASRVPLKLFYLSKLVRFATLAFATIVLVLLAYILVSAWNPSTYQQIGKFMVWTTASALLVYLVGLASKTLATAVNLRSVIKRKIGFAILFIVAFIVCNIYVLFFNGLYNKHGKIDS